MSKRFDNLFAELMLAAAGIVLTVGGWILCRSIRQAEAVPAPIPVAEVALELPPQEPLPSPTPIPTPDPFYSASIPLSPELQITLYEACQEADVPLALALGVIQVESCFQPDAVSPEGCYGLMQLNPRFFPDKLSPAENIRAGVSYLGELLNKYGDTGAALTVYNAGYDTGSRAYASVVLREAEWWEDFSGGGQ